MYIQHMYLSISSISVYVCVYNILTSFHYRIECKSRKFFQRGLSFNICESIFRKINHKTWLNYQLYLILFIFNKFFCDFCLDKIQATYYAFWNLPINKLQTSVTSIILELSSLLKLFTKSHNKKIKKISNMDFM